MNEGWVSDEDDKPGTSSGGNQRNKRGNNDDNVPWRGHGGRTFRNKALSRVNDVPNSVTIIVRTNNLGKIIGRSGCRIQELQTLSGAKIKIGAACRTDYGRTTEVTLCGSEEAKRKAKKLIEEIENPTPPPTAQVNVKQTPKKDDKPIDMAQVNKEYEAAQKKKWAALPTLIKDFYHEHSDVARMTRTQVNAFKQQNNKIRCSFAFGKGTGHVPNPVQTFEQAFAKYPEILVQISKQNFKKPSPIQAQAWPILLSGYDLIGIAQTGTGKTLAYLLPSFVHIYGQPVPRSQRGGANVLVLAPTRELALQIEKEVKKLKYQNIRCVCVYGGGDRNEQIKRVERGVEIIIATPGRMNDLVQAGVIKVSSITYLVLDEADRMLDMGFEPQIRKILLDVRPDRQTVMTSATWPLSVRRLAESYTKNPIQVCIGSLDLAAVHSVTQLVEFVEEDCKDDRLMEFVSQMAPADKVIVFVSKKNRADNINSEIALKGVKVQSIHGDIEQPDREQALEDMKSGDVRILIATDVASRGIDIEDITHIFNYDFPSNIEDYIHRIGRTGRAGKTGKAISLFTKADATHAKELISILEEAKQDVPEMLRRMSEWKGRRNKRGKGRQRSGSSKSLYKGGGGGGGGGGSGGGGGGFGEGNFFDEELNCGRRGGQNKW